MVWMMLLLGCAPQAEVHALSGRALGTTWTAKWVGQVDEARGADEITRVLGDIDRQMSTWRDDSEINAVRAGGSVAVSQPLMDVVQHALTIAARTGGAFDPTVEPLMEVWGLHGNKRTAPPTDDELAAARAGVGWQRVRLSMAPPAIDAGGTALDLSAIAKGYAVDRVGLALSQAGASSWFVEIGGEVRASGNRGDGPWRVAVEAPEHGAAPGEFVAQIVELRNQAVASSGNYRNFYELDGERIHHTLDPRLGRPTKSETLATSVIAPTCEQADAWATALMVLSPAEGQSLIEADPTLEAVWVLPSGTIRSSGFPSAVR